ncbi:LLM class flavin-dependent oxidoreductase [Nocardioides mangrovicus]|uniref:LLM class flavin-dependent oxidoreductase n=1 Tax=Nocardioides mangrovicus TaxID=2478913 RepID=A0A3L8P4R7_9ACTN|nr:LLM class flavin-dependent oxidoreductase [Nocardioides mangrovicus]RLV50114.1 LLM class flavin-dependent oxidoreductase [Nocardioides mangrovicus]
MEFGVFSLTDVAGDTTVADRVRTVIDLGVHADEVGLDVFGVGEHHTPRFAVSSPAVVLSAIAARTTSIRLTSTVSVLSVLDPVRLYQDFAQLDLVAAGRAEVTVGRSAYAEPFGLFGVPIADYDAVFEEKLDLLVSLRDDEPVTWTGRYRPPLANAHVVPRLSRPLPVWVGVGGTPASATGAGRRGLPLSLALLGGTAARSRPLVDAYREAFVGRDRHAHTSIAGVSHFYVGPTSQQARETFYPYYRTYFADGRGVHLDRATFEQMAGPRGPLVVGSAAEVADKVSAQHEVLGVDRFLGQVDLGGLHTRLSLASMDRLAHDVVPQFS